MANIKSICSLLILTAVLCCGCDNASTSSPVSSAGTTSATTNATTSATAEADSSQHSQSKIQSEETSEAVSTAEPIYPEYSESNDPFSKYWITLEAEYKYEDDTVPENWIPICTASEVIRNFDELAKGDTSCGDISDIITLLVNRHVFIFEMDYLRAYDIKLDEEYVPEGSENVFYPTPLKYYPDIDSITRLVYGTYNADVAHDYLYWEDDSRPMFLERNGQPYVNIRALSNWSMDPFAVRSYIEIVETSNDRCTFIWHYPDIEGLNEPTDYKYHYFESKYSASLVDGAWVLNSIILNNGISE